MIVANQTAELQNVLNLCDPINTYSAYDVAMLLERLIDLMTQHFDQFQLVNTFQLKERKNRKISCH